METEDPPNEYFSKSDSEKWEVDVGEELLDLIIAIGQSVEHNMKMHTKEIILRKIGWNWQGNHRKNMHYGENGMVAIPMPAA